MNSTHGNADSWLKKHPRLITAAWVGYWFILTGLLLSPKLPRPPIQISKKALFAHFSTFAILAAVCYLARRARGLKVNGAWYALWFIVFSAYGGIAELIQPLVHRHADVADWLADSAGVGLVFIITAIYDQGKKRNSENQIKLDTRQ